MASTGRQEATVTPEGWTVEDPDFYGWCMDWPPPRPHAYRRQLVVDATSWKPLAFWAVGLGCLVLAVATAYWLLVVPGVWVLSVWFRMFRRAARSCRDNQLLVGTVTTLGPHPLLKTYSTADAVLADGRHVLVVLPTWLASDLLKEHRCVEVLFLHDIKAEYGLVIGARPAPKQPAP